MSALVKLKQAARLRRAACRQGRIPTAVEPVETTTRTSVEPVETTTPTETGR